MGRWTSALERERYRTGQAEKREDLLRQELSHLKHRLAELYVERNEWKAIAQGLAKRKAEDGDN